MGANKINSQDIDWSGSTGYANGAYLGFGGAFQVPTGAIPALSNIIWVAKNGNDTTALTAFTAAGNKQVFAYPFLTLAAARSAAVSLTPSATNRILIKVFSGLYVEQLVLANYVDWDLGNAIIDLQTNAATYTITDNNVACNCMIYGNATILRSDGAAALGCVNILNSGSVVTINCALINTTFGHSIVHTDGFLYINSNISSSINGILANGTELIINGNLTTTNGYGITMNGIELVINGEINTNLGNGIIINSGAVYYTGNLQTTNIGLVITSGSINFNGDINSAGDGINITAGITNFNGNIYSASSGVLLTTSGVLNMNGIIELSQPGNGIRAEAGTVNFNGIIYNTSTNNCLDFLGTAIGNINANLYGGIASNPAIILSDGVTFTFSGDIKTLGGQYIQYNTFTGSSYIKNSIMRGATGDGIDLSGVCTGSLFLSNCNLISTQNCIDKGAGGLALEIFDSKLKTTGGTTVITTAAGSVILKNSVLVGGAVGSISGAGNIIIYNTCYANVATSGVTQLIGTIVVDAAVV